jgi:hypothetical protein
MLGQADLGEWIQIASGETLWTRQREIARAISVPRAHVAVPSCNASGKTWLAGRIVQAFYDAYTPGTPCIECDPTGTMGGCRGSKVITTSSKYEHLRDNLWGELRMSFPKISRRVGMDGRLYEGDLRLEGGPDHFITGQSAASAEGMQGYHSAHKLILGDEATAVSEEVSQGITGLLASGDARLLLIFNPTTPDTYAATQARSPRTDTIKITAYDTPNFTGEKVPQGANLVNQGFLDDLEAQGMGPGSYEWTTRVLAEFWDLSDNTLIPETWVDKAWKPIQDGTQMGATRQVGIDLATYGNAESVVVVREGDEVIDLKAFPSSRMDNFWRGPVMDIVRQYGPHYVVYDADGVGAGVIGYAEDVQAQMIGGGQLIPFRGAKKINEQHTNARSAWWWHLRRRFEADRIRLCIPRDPKLIGQLTSVGYTIEAGKIKVETKETMRKRGVGSPDRGDALVYAFAFSDDLVTPIVRPNPTPVSDHFGIRPNPGDRDEYRPRRYPGGKAQGSHPILGSDW